MSGANGNRADGKRADGNRTDANRADANPDLLPVATLSLIHI